MSGPSPNTSDASGADREQRDDPGSEVARAGRLTDLARPEWRVPEQEQRPGHEHDRREQDHVDGPRSAAGGDREDAGDERPEVEHEGRHDEDPDLAPRRAEPDEQGDPVAKGRRAGEPVDEDVLPAEPAHIGELLRNEQRRKAEEQPGEDEQDQQRIADRRESSPLMTAFSRRPSTGSTVPRPSAGANMSTNRPRRGGCRGSPSTSEAAMDAPIGVGISAPASWAGRGPRRSDERRARGSSPSPAGRGPRRSPPTTASRVVDVVALLGDPKVGPRAPRDAAARPPGAGDRRRERRQAPADREADGEHGRRLRPDHRGGAAQRRPARDRVAAPVPEVAAGRAPAHRRGPDRRRADDPGDRADRRATTPRTTPGRPTRTSRPSGPTGPRTPATSRAGWPAASRRSPSPPRRATSPSRRPSSPRWPSTSFGNGVLADIWLTYEISPPGLGSALQFLDHGLEGHDRLRLLRVGRLGDDGRLARRSTSSPRSTRWTRSTRSGSRPTRTSSTTSSARSASAASRASTATTARANDRDGRGGRAVDPLRRGRPPAAAPDHASTRGDRDATEHVPRAAPRAGRPTFGTHLFTQWPTIVEVVGHTGNFDYIEFSGEYAPYDLFSLENWVRATELYGMSSMIKLDQEPRVWLAERAIGAGFQSRPVRRHPHGRRGPGRGQGRPRRRARASTASTASPTGASALMLHAGTPQLHRRPRRHRRRRS